MQRRRFWSRFAGNLTACATLEYSDSTLGIKSDCEIVRMIARNGCAFPLSLVSFQLDFVDFLPTRSSLDFRDHVDEFLFANLATEEHTLPFHFSPRVSDTVAAGGASAEATTAAGVGGVLPIATSGATRSAVIGGLTSDVSAAGFAAGTGGVSGLAGSVVDAAVVPVFTSSAADLTAGIGDVTAGIAIVAAAGATRSGVDSAAEVTVGVGGEIKTTAGPGAALIPTFSEDATETSGAEVGTIDRLGAAS